MKRYLFLLLAAFFSGTVLWGATISFTGPKNMVVYLEKREVDHLDNGAVEGNVSLADKAKFSEAEAAAEKKEPAEAAE
jgi:hypothetical protein